MNDSELLQLAAKAAGIEIYWEKCLTNAGTIFSPHLKINGTWGHGQWNPLTDDGDTLRLAVKLRLTVEITPWAADSHQWCEKKSEDFGIRHTEYDDEFSATRRAIVRAAAEIGKKMKEKEDEQ